MHLVAEGDGLGIAGDPQRCWWIDGKCLKAIAGEGRLQFEAAERLPVRRRFADQGGLSRGAVPRAGHPGRLLEILDRLMDGLSVCRGGKKGRGQNSQATGHTADSANIRIRCIPRFLVVSVQEWPPVREDIFGNDYTLLARAIASETEVPCDRPARPGADFATEVAKKSPRKGCVPGGRRTLTFPGAIGRFRAGPAVIAGSP